MFREGSEDPLAALLDAYLQPLARFIARRVRGDAQAVEDLIQVTLERVVAYHDRHGLPSEGEAVRLLYTIAALRIIELCHVLGVGGQTPGPVHGVQQ